MKKKKLLAGILALALAGSVAGCNGIGKGKVDGKEATLWAECSTVKIKQFDEGKAVKEAGNKNVLKINMARNESEGVELMMYAKKDIESYNVSVSDLKSDDGVISADQIDIYHVFYQTVEGNGKIGNPNFASGEVPDPMLPIETAVEYGETKVEKGENQMVFIDVETTKDTPAGVYTGTAEVTIDETEYTMPIEVTVNDVVYPDNRGLKTAFSLFDRDHFSSAEMDASDEQTRAYVDTLLEYNMSGNLPYEGVGGIEAYLELLKEYYDKPGFSSYRLYYQTAGGSYNGKPVQYNASLLKEYIIAIAKMSVEEKKNYLDKAYAYFYTVADEPHTKEQFLTAKAALDSFNDILRDADKELRYLYAGTGDYDYYDETISEELLHIEEVLPGSYDIGDAKKYGLDNLTFIPEISYLHTESDRTYYTEGREDRELWTYTCVGPVYPYPSGHTDDYSLGFRLTSWMCHDYDWDGFLMWSTADYLNLEYGEVKEDAWTTMDTGQGRPGDGKLFYPGAKYGLDTPCPSLRAVAYRDGVDDYALLEAVSDVYKEQELDASAALAPVYEELFSGVIPTTDSELFETVKAEVFDMLRDLQSDVGVLYAESSTELASATFTFKTTNDQATVEADGKKLTPNAEGLYEVTVDLTKQSEYTFTVSCNKEKKTYTRILLNGKLGSVNGFEDATDLADYVFSSTKGYEGSVYTGKDYAYDGEKSAHLVLNKDKEDTLPYFAIEKASKLIGGSWKDISTMKFYVYNAGKKDVTMDATYYTSQEVSVGTFTLPAGKWTRVEINMPQDIKDVETIQEFDFNFEQGSSVELYLDSFATVVEKGE